MFVWCPLTANLREHQSRLSTHTYTWAGRWPHMDIYHVFLNSIKVCLPKPVKLLLDWSNQFSVHISQNISEPCVVLVAVAFGVACSVLLLSKYVNPWNPWNSAAWQVNCLANLWIMVSLLGTITGAMSQHGAQAFAVSVEVLVALLAAQEPVPVSQSQMAHVPNCWNAHQCWALNSYLQAWNVPISLRFAMLDPSSRPML